MSVPRTLLQSELPLPLIHRGKVRELYHVDQEHLLMVASDRVSAFDVVMEQPIPRKGEVLTLITAWWLEQFESRFPHHLVAAHPDSIADRVPSLRNSRDIWARRALLVRKTQPLPVECVVRGYLAGSAWKEYQQSETLAGEPMPKGLRESARLDPPLFSPATKAVQGHDENIAFGDVAERLGDVMARRLRDLSLAIYEVGRAVAAERGILLADTKFEFGRTESGELLLIDEVLTPDSSRYWPEEAWEPGSAPPSFDKQPIRDWLEARPDWDKAPPPPDLTAEVIDAASIRYQEIFRRLTGVDLDVWEPVR